MSLFSLCWLLSVTSAQFLLLHQDFVPVAGESYTAFMERVGQFAAQKKNMSAFESVESLMLPTLKSEMEINAYPLRFNLVVAATDARSGEGGFRESNHYLHTFAMTRRVNYWGTETDLNQPWITSRPLAPLQIPSYGAFPDHTTDSISSEANSASRWSPFGFM